MTEIKERIKADWEKQPLAIMIGAISVASSGIYFLIDRVLPANRASSALEQSVFGGMSSASIPLYLALTPLVAWLAGRFFRRSFMSGFFLSILIASLGMALFIGLEREAIFDGALLSKGQIESPLTDLLYWTTFLVFMGICWKPMVERLVEANPVRRKKVDGVFQEDGGITNGEVIMAILLWGLVLSAAEAKILRFFGSGIEIPLAAQTQPTQ